VIVPRLTYGVLSSAVDRRMPYRRTPDTQQDWTFALRSPNPRLKSSIRLRGVKHDSQGDQRAELHAGTVGSGARPCFGQAQDRPSSIARAHGSEQALQHDKVGSAGDFRRHVPACAPRGVLAVPRHLAFNTHLVDTSQQVRSGHVSDGAPEPVRLAAQGWMSLRPTRARLGSERRPHVVPVEGPGRNRACRASVFKASFALPSIVRLACYRRC
jgi:hypothetical protein